MKHILLICIIIGLTNSAHAMGKLKVLLSDPYQQNLPSQKDDLVEIRKSKITFTYDIRVKLDGITNSFTQQILTKAFLDHEDIDTIDINMKKSQIDIVLKKRRKLKDEAIKKIINDAGFNVTKILRAIS